MSRPGAVTVVIPNWNGRRWLPGCLAALAAQSLPPGEVVVVDNGSHDGSREYLSAAHPAVRVLSLERNTGFAHAANLGLAAARGEIVALLNTDVVLASDWLARMTATLGAHPTAASATGKMVALHDPGEIYDAGDVLRRDGACDQRGRFSRDDGRYDMPGEVWGACAGAAVYRREAVLALGGFDERYFAYLEDADLALRLRLAGWTCRYEPAVARHAGEGSSAQLPGGHAPLVTRNGVLLVIKAFPVRWAPFVAYRQLSWAVQAVREGRLLAHGRALGSIVPLLPYALRERRRLRREAVTAIEQAIPAVAIRDPRARAAGRRAAGYVGQRG